MDPQEKSDRLIEAACAVLSAAPLMQLNAVVLNKALFYLDLASLRDRATTITGNTYIAIAQGPVVAKYPRRLIDQLTGLGLAQQISEWDGSKPIVLLQKPERRRFLDDESVTLASAVSTYFARMSSTQASQFSHENPGWRIAWNEYRRVGRPQPVNLRIALQQIVEDDPWMDLPFADDDTALAAADADDGAEW